MIVQGIFMLFEVFHFFKLIIVTNAIFFAKPSGRMFLRFIDHRIQLYPMVVNNWSSDAMFAIYHPSRYTTIKFRQRGKSFYKGCPTIPILQRRFGHCEKAVRLVKCGIPKHQWNLQTIRHCHWDLFWLSEMACSHFERGAAGSNINVFGAHTITIPQYHHWCLWCPPSSNKPQLAAWQTVHRVGQRAGNDENSKIETFLLSGANFSPRH